MLINESAVEDGLEQYKRERTKVFRKQLRMELFASALPVFLGAIWSEAMMGVFGLVFQGHHLNDAKLSVRAINWQAISVVLFWKSR